MLEKEIVRENWMDSDLLRRTENYVVFLMVPESGLTLNTRHFVSRLLVYTENSVGLTRVRQ